MKGQNYKITWKSFEYINQLADFFDFHREYELISFSVGKNCDSFLAIYKDFSNINTEITQ